MTFSPSLQPNNSFYGSKEANVQGSQPQELTTPAELVISNKKLTHTGKLIVVIASVTALLACTILSLCIAAACGHFPLLLSFLNMCTAGACLSLPLLVTLSITILAMSAWAVRHILAQPFSVQLVSSRWF